MKKVSFLIIALTVVGSLSVQSQTKINTDDFTMLIGNWEGSITYLDYQTNKPYTMAANLQVERGNKETKLVFKNIYPNEPKANGSDTVKVSKDGTVLNGSLVTSREVLEDGNIEIQTEQKGKDDNKKALIRYTYLIGKRQFVITKKVQFDPAEAWIKRSEYSYMRMM